MTITISCLYCNNGTMILRNGKYGEYYNCANCNKNINRKKYDRDNNRTQKQQKQPQTDDHYKSILDWFKLTNEHEQIINAYNETDKNLIINATFGSGKTTLMIYLMYKNPTKKFLYLAFNNSIVKEFETKIPSNSVTKTLHSLGLSIVRANLNHQKIKFEIDNQKVKKITQDLLVSYFGQIDMLSQDDKRIFYEYKNLIVNLVEKNKQYLRDFTRDFMLDLIDVYNLDLTDSIDMLTLHNLSFEVVKQSDSMLTKIDFSDMLRFACKSDFFVPQITGDLTIDETQDLNEVQIELLKRFTNRKIFIGDENQSIYGFRGALTDSMTRIKNQFDCVPLSLNGTRRVPQNLLDLYLSDFVPDVYSLSKNEGFANGVFEDEFIDELKKVLTVDDEVDCLVLCRTNAPLVKFCLRAINEGIRSKILGKSIGTQIAKIVTEIEKTDSNFENFLDNLQTYEIDQTNKLNAKKLYNQVDILADKIQTIKAIFENDLVMSFLDVYKKIDELFDDTIDNRFVVFATGHKAKGMETKKLFVLYPHLLPLVTKRPQTDDQKQQEINVKIVVYSRTKEYICEVFEKIE